MLPHDQQSQSTYERASKALAGTGWTVIHEPLEPPFIGLVFEHPLSASFSLTLTTDRPVNERLDRFFAQREFAVVAKAPSHTEHASLIRLLRQRAAGHKWPEGVLGEVADVLAVHHLLTEEEADWLAEAGGPWDDDDDGE